LAAEASEAPEGPFQALEGIVGEPLAGVLATLGGLAGERQLTFFRERRDDLEGLTPVEVLLGHILEQKEVTKAAASLTISHPRTRHGAVLTAAEHFRCEIVTAGGNACVR